MLVSLIRFVFGFLVAVLVAGAVQVLFVAGGDLLASLSSAERWQSLGLLALLAATQTAVFSIPFAVLAAAVAAWLPARSALYFLAAGVGIGLAGFFVQYISETGPQTILNLYALAAYAASGAVGGLAYWALAAPQPRPSTAEKT
ncbi:hypothetical protein [Hyphomicrobium sp. CS1GBMeth3]|uniref:hypothetical protein n=1 Tax=Hyphomicrobium sp. CS1GBMeth3 TaxID=1892845 RepID=UPI0009304B65|nr:hypothetical protein [Hyphomicrobium sp. CS1GBMeth3]